MTTSFSMGISYLLHSHFPSSTSSSSSSSSQPLSFHVKKNSNNNEMTGRRRVVSACMGQEDPKDIVFSKKRAVLFLGISVLPFLQLRARALEGLVTTWSPNSNGSCSQPDQSYFEFCWEKNQTLLDHAGIGPDNNGSGCNRTQSYVGSCWGQDPTLSGPDPKQLYPGIH